ncbi:MAG TPA: PAS domain S-box protein [Candidatus Limnocylindrales bacterium]|nr:PAS domain S-box protein [Candidatus Limnocylindrales bacterium]
MTTPTSGPDTTTATGSMEWNEAIARLAAIVESSSDAILSKTLDGTITSWNPAAERMFGYRADEVIGRSIRIIVPAECQAEEDGVLARLRQGERIEHYETVRLRKDGRRIDVSLSISPVRGGSGEFVGAATIVRDVTDRKRMERERGVLLAEAQAANRSKDEFLAMLGHELRNPLAAIANATQALALAPDASETQRPREVIERQLERLSRLVDDLLDAAQVQAGKVHLQLERMRLGDVVRQTIAALGATEHAIELNIDDRVEISGDPGRLRQVLHNLMANAVQYTPRGKAIRIRCYGERDDAVVQITDEGIGIAADILPRIFDLFVQGHRASDRIQGGLGIGLTLARKLVELHGGSLAASSAGPGLGSVFTVRIPRLPAEAGSSRDTEAVTGPRRVLVVEDNEDTREMFKMVLQLKGHDVLEAADGAEAVEVALRERPEIAFVDIGLPVMDGYEVARELRRKMGSEILLIAVTGYGQPEDEACALRAGFDEHAVKPLAPPRLADILRRRL